MQPEEFFATQRAHGTLNFPTHATPLLHRSRFEGSIETKKMTTIDESAAAGTDIQSRIGQVNGVLYLYGTPPLILFCVISIAINIKVLMSVFWIKRPLSPTLHISLSLAGADAFSSTALGIGLIMNSFIPYGLGIELKVKKHQATRLRFRRTGSSFRPRASEALRSTSRQMAKNVKAVHTTLFILGSFLIGWMPGVMMYMLVCEDCLFQLNWMSGHSTFFIYTIINCLIILKTLVNPIIYAARMHEIKAATRRMRNSFCEWVTAVTGITTNRDVNRVHSSEKTRSRHSQSRQSTYRSSRNVSGRSSRNVSGRSSKNVSCRSSRNGTCRSSRNGTCRSSHNVSIQRARDGSTYTCTVCNVRECGNTLV